MEKRKEGEKRERKWKAEGKEGWQEDEKREIRKSGGVSMGRE